MCAMSPHNRDRLFHRVVKAAEAALAAQHYVSCIDVLVGLGWIDSGTVKRWRNGQIEYLERVVQANLARISEAMKQFRSWAAQRGLLPRETEYVARTLQRQRLRFSRSGDAAIERFYRTHWVSRVLTKKKTERLLEKASRPPELLVFSPLDRDWACHTCGGSGSFLMMEEGGPACLGCVGMGDLKFLAKGDSSLTRRVKEASPRYAIVVRWSRTRKRYERQGLLAEPKALAEAELRLEEERSERRS
jgi:hypothetical protein